MMTTHNKNTQTIAAQKSMEGVVNRIFSNPGFTESGERQKISLK